MKSLYDTDFVEWTERSAHLLRSGRFSEADIEHIAGEIEDLGKRDRRDVDGAAVQLIAHLLKWRQQPPGRPGDRAAFVTLPGTVPLHRRAAPRSRLPARVIFRMAAGL